MCGIAGFLGLKHGHSPNFLIRSMTSALVHRGPDDIGIWLDEDAEIALGHQRLSILDLSMAGHQPMHSACGRYLIVFNGEIYNHQQIRDKLQVKNNKFQGWGGHSDTETLLTAFSEWGIENTLKACVGMFAIALWDKQKRVLTLARDRMGEKPLYFGWQDGTFMFASELKSLKVHPAFKSDVDRQALTQLLRFNYIPTPMSIYKGISKLPPGTFLNVSVDHCQFGACAISEPVTYWSLSDAAVRGQVSPFVCSDDEAIDTLEQCLGDAIEGQKIADVPLGAFLSGGIDSSLIVALMQAHSCQPIKTFTIGFDESDYNEAKHAKAVAKYLGTEHTEFYSSPQDALDVIPLLPQLYDEPFADSSQIPTFLVSQMAKKHVSVALSGDGGDELFGGYNRHIWSRSILQKTNLFPTSLRHILSSMINSVSLARWDRLNELLSQILPHRYRLVQAGEKVRKLARVMTMDNASSMYQGLVSQCFDPAIFVKGGSEPLQVDLSGQMSFQEIEHEMMFIDAMTYLPDDILCKVDRAAMGVSLEVRSPLLDHRVVELAWSLPLHMKIRNGQGKWILRQILDRHVPRELIERPKQGFSIPLGEWLRGPLRDWAEELLNASRLQQEGYWNTPLIRKMWEDHLKGESRQGQLWSILMFQAWLGR